MKIRTALCIILVLSLVIAVPVASAEDEPIPTIELVNTKCVKISPYDMPPISIYDCPKGQDP